MMLTSNTFYLFVLLQMTKVKSLASAIINGNKASAILVGSLCDQLLQQFHRVNEELSIQGKWQGGSVTGVCKGWGTNKVRSIVHSLSRLGDY